MRLLAIETSCDETSIAIVSERDGNFTIEKNLTSSQAEVHAQYGGVVPEVAAREHAAWIIPLLRKVGVAHDGTGIDAVAVTAGPGLVPALRVGVELAKTLAWAWHKPLVAVNHLEGHIYSVWLSDFKAPFLPANLSPDLSSEARSAKEEAQRAKWEAPATAGGASAFDRPEGRANPRFPAVCLLVSGGHTELILMRDHGVYELLGMTRDDAAGEAFDKVAKLLGLPYPGGPQISKAALKGDATAIDFPRPMIDSDNFDFSFAGLKTAVRVYLESISPLSKGGQRGVAVANVAASFQQAVVDTLVTKTLRAVEKFRPASVILSGGVSANSLLRQTLESRLNDLDSIITFHAPELILTGDNAAMIGAAGLMKATRGEFVDPLTLEADPNMRLA